MGSWFAIALLCALLVSPFARAEPCTLAGLSWILGDWQANTKSHTVTEVWFRLDAERFAGKAVWLKKSTGVARAEDLLIAAMGDEVFYLAKIASNPYPVPFKLTSCKPGRAVFTNPQHDFPKRLEYSHGQSGELQVVVGDMDNAAFELVFRSMLDRVNDQAQ